MTHGVAFKQTGKESVNEHPIFYSSVRTTLRYVPHSPPEVLSRMESLLPTSYNSFPKVGFLPFSPLLLHIPSKCLLDHHLNKLCVFHPYVKVDLSVSPIYGHYICCKIQKVYNHAKTQFYHYFIKQMFIMGSSNA